jgi:hypothetical protein
MTASALALAPTSTEPPREATVPRAIRRCIDLMLTGNARTQKDAADQVGISPEYLSRSLAKGHVQEWRKRRIAHAIDGLKVDAVGEAHRLLLGAASEHVRKDLVVKVLARELEPEAGSTNLTVSVGYVIKLGEARSGPAHGTPEAKPLIEHEDQP